MTRFLWRLLPIVLILYTMRGAADQYGRYLKMAKQASYYTMTYMALAQYVPALQTYYKEQNRLPEDLGGFFRAHFSSKGQDAALDPWETPYALTEDRDQFTLTSCGSDRTCPTDDDLSSSGSKSDKPVPLGRP